MQFPTGSRRLVPTWRMVEGECRDSLALEVAARCRLPPELVARASAFVQVPNIIATTFTYRAARRAGQESTMSWVQALEQPELLDTAVMGNSQALCLAGGAGDVRDAFGADSRHVAHFAFCIWILPALLSCRT